MTHRFMSLATVLAITLATPAVAQNRDFHWTGTISSGNRVSVSNVNGEIHVTTSTTGRVEVTGIKRGNGRDIDAIRADVQQTSRGLVICVLYDDANATCDDRGGSRSRSGSRNDRDWNNARIDLDVSVPASATVSASSVSGDVQVVGAQGDIEASSVSGDVRLEQVRASSLRVNSVSGNITVKVDAFTGRGDLSFGTVSGDVTLEMPRQLDADVSMSTVSGGMDSDYQMTVGNGRMNRRSINARIGSGGRRLDLNTVSGDVRLRMGSR